VKNHRGARQKFPHPERKRGKETFYERRLNSSFQKKLEPRLRSFPPEGLPRQNGHEKPTAGVPRSVFFPWLPQKELKPGTRGTGRSQEPEKKGSLIEGGGKKKKGNPLSFKKCLQNIKQQLRRLKKGGRCRHSERAPCKEENRSSSQRPAPDLTGT